MPDSVLAHDKEIVEETLSNLAMRTDMFTEALARKDEKALTGIFLLEQITVLDLLADVVHDERLKAKILEKALTNKAIVAPLIPELFRDFFTA